MIYMIWTSKAFLQFYPDEVMQMPKWFRVMFRRNGSRTYVERGWDGKRAAYLLTYRKDGFSIRLGGWNVLELKQRFIEAVNSLPQPTESR